MTPLIVIVCYLGMLLALGVLSGRSFRGTSKDYFVASHSIGPFLLLMSVFGTTMTAFALVGSTGKAFERGIGTYGLMASSSGLIHAACFFLIGIRLWTYGKKHGYVTQIQFFRARFESDAIGYMLFPLLVGFVIPYLLIGVIGAGKTLQPATAGAFPELFQNASPILDGGIPPWLSGLVICGIVLTYVFMGGSRGAAWANTFQTLVFMIMGVVAFAYISNNLGGMEAASKAAMRATDTGALVQTNEFVPGGWQKVTPDIIQIEGMDGKIKARAVFEDGKTQQITKFDEATILGLDAKGATFERFSPRTFKDRTKPRTVGKVRLGGEHDKSDGKDAAAAGVAMPEQPHLTRTVVTGTHKDMDPKTKKPKVDKDGKPVTFEREYGIPPLMFLSYMFIPLSVGMFPHLFQHWLTAKSANTFKLTLVAHPIFIMIVWVPCVLIGVWASGVLPPLPPGKIAAVLSIMVKTLVNDPVLVGLLTAGILAAIMSSLDSQFLCMGTIFTNDIVLHRKKNQGKYNDKQIILIARGFTVFIVVLTYVLSLLAAKANVFDLAVWCFSGFSALFPLVFGALYWRRATKAGAMASIIAVVASWIFFFTLASLENHSLGGEYTVGPGIMPAAICFACGAVALVVVSLITPPPSQETLDKFFPKKQAKTA